MKKTLAFLLGLILIIGLMGCSSTADTQDQTSESASVESAESTESAAESSSEEASEAASTGETYKLGVVLQSIANESQAYWQILFNEFSADYGFDVTIYDGTDATVQTTAVRDCIAQEDDVILICATDTSAVVPALQEAKQAGIIVGLINATIDPMDETDYDFYVGVDDVLGGQAAAEAFIKQFPDGANVVEIGGGAGSSPAINRHDGFVQGLEGSNINVLEYEACSDWIANEAMGIMENMIVKYGDEIDGVYVQWDNGATTAIQALQAADMNDVYVVAVDGCSAGFDQVKDGTQAVTVMQNFDKMIPQALADAQKAVTGQEYTQNDILDWEIVTIDNIDDFQYPQW